MITSGKVGWVFRKYAWALWLGIMTTSFGISITDTAWWLYIVPLCLLIGISEKQALVDQKNELDKQNDKPNSSSL